MAALRTFNGLGRIIASGNDLGSVEYSISEFMDGHFIAARGTLSGPSRALWEAMQAGGAVLLLEGGQTADIIVVSHQIGDDEAKIVVSGPLPKP